MKPISKHLFPQHFSLEKYFNWNFFCVFFVFFSGRLLTLPNEKIPCEVECWEIVNSLHFLFIFCFLHFFAELVKEMWNKQTQREWWSLWSGFHACFMCIVVTVWKSRNGKERKKLVRKRDNSLFHQTESAKSFFFAFNEMGSGNIVTLKFFSLSPCPSPFHFKLFGCLFYLFLTLLPSFLTWKERKVKEK